LQQELSISTAPESREEKKWHASIKSLQLLLTEHAPRSPNFDSLVKTPVNLA